MKQLFCAALLAISSIAAAAAQEVAPFTKDRFDALQAQGAVVLVDVFAPWCPTCRKQKQLLEDYRADHPNADFHTLVVDFDHDKKWVNHFKAPYQSTLVLYVGDKKVWFSVAETRAAVIAAKLDAALAQAGDAAP